MAKMRVRELAKEINVNSSDVLNVLSDMGVEGKTSASGLEDDQVEAVKAKLMKKAAPAKPVSEEAKKVEKAEEKKAAPEGEKHVVKKAAGEMPKKKKPIIIVSNRGGASSQGTRGGFEGKRDANRPDNRQGQNGGQRQQGIIRPTVPTTAERAARLAETSQGGDRDRIRKQSQMPIKTSQNNVEATNDTSVNNGSGANNSAPSVGTTGANEEVKAVATTVEAVANTQTQPKNDRDNRNDKNDRNNRNDNNDRNNRGDRNSDRPNRGDRDNRGDRNGNKGDRNNGNRNERFNNDRNGNRSNNGNQRNGQNGGNGGRGGIVINQGRNFSAPDEPTRDEKRNGNDRRNNSGKDKNKKDRIYENEDGMRGGKQVKGNKAKMLERPTEKKVQPEEEKIKVITLPESITIKDLADKMKIQASQIIKKLFLQGQVVTVNQEISYEQAEEIAVEYEILCEKEVVVDVIEELLREDEEDEATMTSRPPVICVMGHVDHGKTSLLDAIRNTRVIDREAGGITQHIGAYVVDVNGKKITFLDTPGHEAFTAMRMRGANSTDIAILVVAADDGVMPQTVEAINHAKAAGIEIIVAVNKIDKPSANIDRVKQELSEYELVPEDWGGSTIFAPVSAKTGDGIEDLLDMILLTSDILELKANAKRKARGLVIEAQLDKGRGPVATILVQKGTLKVGDFIAAGASNGKVRAMIDDQGRRVKEAGPSTPVEILGLNDVPGAGEVFVALDSDKEAKQFAQTFQAQNKAKLLDDTKSKMSLDQLFSQIEAGNLKELNLIIKADVQGSVEAVKESLLKLSNEEVIVKVIHSGVGAINESDVILASASNAIIIGFNVRPDTTSKATAEAEGVDVRLYDVIYKAIEDVEAAMKGMLDPIFEEKIIGHAEIRQIFKASGVGNIAGSYVMDGVMQRGSLIRITRAGEQIYEGKLSSLKRFKDDAKEVKQGFECGLVFEDFNDLQEFDMVEGYIMVEVPRT